MTELQRQPAGTPVETWTIDYTYSPLMRRLTQLNLTRSAGVPNPLWQRFTYDEDAASEPQGILTRHPIQGARQELGSATLQLDVDTDLADVNERDQVAQYARAWATGGAGTNWYNVYNAEGTVVARWYVDYPVTRAWCYDYDGQGALHRAREVTWTGATPPELCVDSDPNMTEVQRVEYLIDAMGRRVGRRTYTVGVLESGSESRGGPEIERGPATTGC